MNELIEELFEQYASERRNNISMLFVDFAQAIETACKAQRNACLRESDKFKTSLDIKIRDSERESIKNAKIKRCDYEQI